MLYFGVTFNRSGFNVTALSQGFATVDERTFHIGQTEQFQQWVVDIKATPREPALWFFDECDFNNPDYPTDFFRFNDDCNSVFLVNHRPLCNLRQFIFEILTVSTSHKSALATEFVLASALRIFHELDVKPVKSDPLFF
jgi:hypothetical protein